LNVTVDNGTRGNNETFMFENVTRQVKRREEGKQKMKGERGVE